MTGLPPRLLDSARRRAKAWQATVLAALLVGARLVNPGRPLPFDVCLFKHVTGMPCPTCGMTRALCHAVRGDWAQSVACHPLGPLLALALLSWTAWSAAEALRGRPMLDVLRGRLGNRLLAAAFVLALVIWVVRLASGPVVVLFGGATLLGCPVG